MAAAIGEAVHQCPAGRVRIALMHQHIRDPDAQAVDQDHAVRIVGFCKRFRQVERGLDKLPVRAAALAVELMRRGRSEMGIAVLISVICYLRPGEMLRLQRSGLVRLYLSTTHWVLFLFPE